jgi:hypothetical protein
MARATPLVLWLLGLLVVARCVATVTSEGGKILPWYDYFGVH